MITSKLARNRHMLHADLVGAEEMNMNIVIRDEVLEDAGAISEITRAAFEDHPYSHHTEQFIIRALRDLGALTISLVAEMDGKIAGHAAFSPVEISDGSQNWYGLGPVSVAPELQKQGIGKALINRGLELLVARDACGCVLVGDPAYYRRFGFKSLPGLLHEGVPDPFVLALTLKGAYPSGMVKFHEAFWVKE